MGASKKRVSYIEWLRVISMIAVVFNHIGSTAETAFPDTYFKSIGGVLLGAVDWLSHFAVPIFFMISGALLLNPKKDLPLKRLWKRYILRYTLDIVIFGWLFSIMEEVFASQNKGVIKLIGKSFLNMLGGNTWAHMWYLYTLLGIMLILPILRKVTQFQNKVEFKYSLVILFVSLSIIQYIEQLSQIRFGVHLPIDSIYVFYMFVGYYISITDIRIKKETLNILIAFCAVILIIGAYYRIMNVFDSKIGAYYSPVIVIYAICLFTVAKEASLFSHTNKMVETLSNVSFGVYLVHMIFINFVFKFLEINPTMLYGTVGIIIAIVVFGISILCVAIGKKIPVIRCIL